MIRRIFSLLIVTAFLVSPTFAADYLEGRLIVRFKDDVHTQTVKTAIGPVANKSILDSISQMAVPSATTVMTYKFDPKLAAVRLPVGMSVEEAINEYISSGVAVYAEPDYIYAREVAYAGETLPNDPDFNDTVKWDHFVMQTPQAWGFNTGSKNIRVAVIDTGIDYLHEDFYEALPADLEIGGTVDPGESNFVWEQDTNDNNETVYNLLGYDPAGNNIEQDNPDYDPMDVQSHGTHVAGIIGAFGNNGIGIAGVNWRVSLLPVKVFADDSAGAATSHILAGIDWAIENDTDVINMSLGGAGYSQSFYDILDRAYRAGIVVVAAAGNDSTNNDGAPHYPSSYQVGNIVSVMSTNNNDQPSGFTNYGASSVDIAAPGSDIWSTIPDNFRKYENKSGTSMAAPQVAGALALYLAFAQDPNNTFPGCLQTVDEAINMLYESSDKLESLDGLCVTGGRLNVFSLLRIITGGIVELFDAGGASQGIYEDAGCVQAAINDASDGYTVALYDNNWYFENIDTQGKSINFTRINDPNNALRGEAYITVNECMGSDPTLPLLTVAGGLVNVNGLYFTGSQESAVSVSTLADVTIDSCKLVENFGTQNGGAVYVNDSNLTVISSELIDNAAIGSGGAIFGENAAVIALASVDPNGLVDPQFKSLFSGNISANGSGGAVAIIDTTSSLTADFAEFEANRGSFSGGALYVYDSTATVNDCVFTANNTANLYPPYGGGAVFVGGSNGYAAITNSAFESNVSGSDGGAVFVEYATADIVTSTFFSNESLMDGGAVYIKYSPKTTITDSVMTDNESELFGGAISINTSDVEMYNMLLYYNRTNWWGGAMYINGTKLAGSNVLLENATIDGNFSSVAGGAIYVSDFNKFDIINSIFTENVNYAVYEGGFMADTVLQNCLFFENPDGDFFDNGVLGYTGAAQLNSVGTNSANLDKSPMYVKGRLGDYYLSHADAGQVLDDAGNIAAEVGTTATSPCYNAGMNTVNYNPFGASTRTDGVDTGEPDIGYHYTDPNAPYSETESLTVSISPTASGTVTPAASDTFKPYSHVILEATGNLGYMFYRWTAADGVGLMPITEDNPFGDYYALYDAKGKLMYVDNGVEGVPYRVVIQLESSMQIRALFERSMVTLRTRVLGGNGKIYQNGELSPLKEYLRGEVVELKAVPDNPQHKIRWVGTDEDSLLTRENTATLRQEWNDVTVEFYQPQVWTVGPQTDTHFDSLRLALTNPNLRPGDIITVMPGEHYFHDNNNPDDPTPGLYVDKAVVIQGGSPGNPDATVIKNGILVFNPNIGRDTIVRDITFDQTNWTYHSGDGHDGGTTPNPHPDGDHGGNGGGAIMDLYSEFNGSTWNAASPTITNCRFVGATFKVGNGGNGQSNTSGDGGWPGICYGGAVNIGNFCKPIFDNCEFIDLKVQGGHGGDGGMGPERVSMPGLWGDPTAYWWPYLAHTSYLPGFGDDELSVNQAFRFVLPHEKKLSFAAQEEKNQYAGRGGAMYIGIGAAPEIRNCRFVGCSAESGSSGVATNTNGAPDQNYRVPSYGGAVFCDAMSKPVFENVQFINNIAHWEQPTTHPNGGTIVNTNNYQSNGGAVYAQRNSTPIFRKCYFEGNSAVAGGAIAVDNNGYRDVDDTLKYLVIEDCEFVENNSDIGGAIAISGGFDSKIRFLSGIQYLTGRSEIPIVSMDFNYGNEYMGELVSKAAGYSMLMRSNFTANRSVIRLDGPAVLLDEDGEPIDPVFDDAFARSGQGGAIAAYSSKTEIADCQFQQNMTGGYGGAIFVSGKSLYDVDAVDEYSTMYVRNCLIANNYAGIGGGGIHTTTHADPQITNCTIADNAVTTAGGKGGGLLVTDVSSVSIINSILHGNLCSNGSQIALAEPHAGQPSNADIRYSLIEPLVSEPPLVDVGLKAVRTINGNDAAAITVDELVDYYQLQPAANITTDLVDLGFTINFYGLTTNRLYVSDNGLVSFWRPITTFSEFVLNSNIETPVIAPFHADVDTSRGNTVSYGRGTVEIEEGGELIECKVFFINYIDVGYFSQRQDKLNSFQLVIIDRSDRAENDFDMEFNYNKIRWETGEAQGGVDGLGGTTARVGFSKGTGIPGTFYEFEGSGVPGAFLDNSTTALIARNRNSKAMGRLRFPVIEGEPQISYGSPVYVEGSGSINYNIDMDMWDPASQNIVGDPLWAVEDFYYLSSTDTGQDQDSPCIDAGAGDAKNFNIYRHSTRIDNHLDTNRVDLGFHSFLPTTKGLAGDFNYDGFIASDESIWAMADYWLNDCGYPYWCHGRDINEDGTVNLVDITAMAKVGTTDSIPPQPMYGEDGMPRATDFTTGENVRMTWEKKPVSVGSGVPEITMTANVAIDNCIGTVQYYFKNTDGSGNDSGWQESRVYTDTGLVIDQEYSYICIARDAHGNETLPSLAVRTFAGDDSEPPVTDSQSSQPTKSKWLVFPQTASIVDGVASIRMVAVTATDINGVEYFFECTSGNGHNSTWQDSPIYVDTGLEVGQLYTYRVKTRDKSRNQNEGEWSDEASATTDPATIVDSDKPYPMAFIANAQQVQRPSPYFSGKQDGWHRITAMAASQDATGPIWYQFICLTRSDYTSPRIYVGGNIGETLDYNFKRIVRGDSLITWEVNVGFPGKTLEWKVICGDSAAIENAYTVEEQPQKVTVGTGLLNMRYESVLNWIITVIADGSTTTYYPADYYADPDNWVGGTATITDGTGGEQQDTGGGTD